MALRWSRLALLLLLWSVKGRFTSGNDLSKDSAAEEWANLINSMQQNSNSQPGFVYGRSSHNVPPYRRVPPSMPVSHHAVRTELFKPDKQTRPLPLSIQEMLLEVTAPPPPPPPTRAPARVFFESLCFLDKMIVRVRKDFFNQNVAKDLTLGKCKVTEENFQHYYFNHSIEEDCGFQKQVGTALSFRYRD